MKPKHTPSFCFDRPGVFCLFAPVSALSSSFLASTPACFDPFVVHLLNNPVQFWHTEKTLLTLEPK